MFSPEQEGRKNTPSKRQLTLKKIAHDNCMELVQSMQERYGEHGAMPGYAGTQNAGVPQNFIVPTNAQFFPVAHVSQLVKSQEEVGERMRYSIFEKKNALIDYSESLYSRINHELRSGRASVATLKMAAVINAAIDDEISRRGSHHVRRAYRGMHLSRESLSDFDYYHRAGTARIVPEFLSTSDNQDIAREFAGERSIGAACILIIVEGGSYATLTAKNARFDEHELLFKAGLIMKTISNEINGTIAGVQYDRVVLLREPDRGNFTLRKLFACGCVGDT